MNSTFSIGFDIGGTHIRAALYGTEELAQATAMAAGEVASGGIPEPMARHREEVGSQRTPRHMVRRIRGMVEQLCSGQGLDRADDVTIGIGIAALFAGRNGHVAVSPHLRWRDEPFGELVRESLGAQTTVLNDCTAATYGEHCVGAGAACDDLLAVFIGTGIGAGMVLGGHLYQGSTGCAGELGHFRVAHGDDAPRCHCGMRGCVEAFIGGHYLTERARRELGGGMVSAATEIAGSITKLHPGHLDQAASHGDRYALELFAEVAEFFAVALGHGVSLLNPSRLLLGGGMLLNMPVLQAHIANALEVAGNRALLDPLELRTCALGDDAGLLGSALLAAGLPVSGPNHDT